MAREICAQCGFDSVLYNQADTISSQRIIPAVLRAAIQALDADDLLRRPDPLTWVMRRSLHGCTRLGPST